MPGMPWTLDLEPIARKAEAFVGRAGPRVLPALRGPQDRVRDRADLRAPRRAVRARVVEAARARLPRGAGRRRRRAGTCSSSRCGGFMGEATKARGDRAGASARRRSRSRSTAPRCRTARRRSAGERAGPRPPRRDRGGAAGGRSTRSSIPLHARCLERSHELARELGWTSYRAMCEELKAVDLARARAADRAFSEATEPRYARALEPAAARADRDRLRRACGAPTCPYFFRAPAFDALFPEERLLRAFEETLGRARDRPPRAAERAARHGAAAAEEPPRVLLAGARARTRCTS